MAEAEAREVDVAEALAAVLARARPLPGERVALAEGLGRALAEPLHARWPLPGADVSTMDGWAVRAEDLAASDFVVALQRRGESAAGHPQESPLAPGDAARISTGAVVPPGADAVVAQEDVAVHGDVIRVDLGRVGAFGPGHFVRRAGSDVAAGAEVLSPGTALGPGDLALAAAAGHAALAVHRAPRVAVLCTGDELVPIGREPGRGQVVSSNGLLLACQIREAGGVAIDLGIAGDEPGALQDALARGLAGADVLLTSGGISVGDHDLVYPALRALGLQPDFRRVRMRPGRPLTFGAIGPVLAFALPGNPASSFVAFELFVRPLLRRLAGHAGDGRARRRLALASPAEGAGRRAHYVRARVREGLAEPLPSQASGALTSLRGCDALLAIPPGPGLPAGAEVEAILLGPGAP